MDACRANQQRASAKRNTGDSSAFTIVELLVVMGIMAIMISLLMPAIGTSQRFAESTGCRNNLRQLASAFLRHNTDYRGRFVLTTTIWHRHTAPDRQTLQLLPYIVDIAPGTPPAGVGTHPVGWPYWRGNLVTFATCPTMHRHVLSDCIITSTYGVNIRAGIPYAGSESIGELPWTPIDSMSQVRHPSDMLAFSDGMPSSKDNYVDGAWWFQKQARISYLGIERGDFPMGPVSRDIMQTIVPYVHNVDRRRGNLREGRVNMSFMDGRVDSRRYEEVREVTLSYGDGDSTDEPARRFWRGR